MNISDREKRYIQVCAIIVVTFLAYFLIFNPIRAGLRTSTGDTASRRQEFRALRQDVKKRLLLDKTLASIEKKLGVSVPEGNSQRQEKEFVKKVEQAANKNQAKISNFSPIMKRTRRSGGSVKAGSKFGFTISYETKQKGLIKFLKELNKIGPPVLINSIQVKNNPKKGGKLNVVMEIETYVFDGKTI